MIKKADLAIMYGLTLLGIYVGYLDRGYYAPGGELLIPVVWMGFRWIVSKVLQFMQRLEIRVK